MSAWLKNQSAKDLAIAGGILVGVAGAVFIAWKASRVAGIIADKVGTVITEDLNPASDKNLANRATNSIFQTATGRDDSPGSALSGFVIDVKSWFQPKMSVYESDAQVLTDPGTVLRYCKLAQASPYGVVTAKCRSALGIG